MQESCGFDCSLRDGRAEGFEEGNDLEADGSAESGLVGVGCIGLPGPPGELADAFGIRALDAGFDHWADEADIITWGRNRQVLERAADGDAAETAGSGAAHEGHQNGFELIVRVVGGRDEAEFFALGEPEQRGIAGGAGSRFEIPARIADPDFGLDELRSHAQSECLHGVEVGENLIAGPKIVEHMGDHDRRGSIARSERQDKGA